MNNIQKKTYIDKDETDSMKKTNNWKKTACDYGNVAKASDQPTYIGPMLVWRMGY